MRRDKKGVLRIVEASIAILLIFGILLAIFINRVDRDESNISDLLTPLLEEIARNDTLRERILNYDTNPEIIEHLEEEYLPGRLAPNIGRKVKICEPANACLLESTPDDAIGDIFAKERIISTTLTREEFEPKKLKIFLYRKRV